MADQEMITKVKDIFKTTELSERCLLDIFWDLFFFGMRSATRARDSHEMENVLSKCASA